MKRGHNRMANARRRVRQYGPVPDVRNATALMATAAVVLGLACARPYPPPGGEEDRTPPRVVAVTPEPMAVVEGWDAPVVFSFNERVSEQQIERAVIVSPATGAVRLERNDRGAELEVSIAGGWRPGTIYRVTILPLIGDLFGNQREAPIELVFSTGPPIPQTALAGLVRARLTGEPAAGARVEAVRAVGPADSLTFIALVDDRGYFFMRNLPPGEYLLRAFEDRNRTGTLDSFEPRDSSAARVAESDTLLLGLGLLPPDSTAARLISAEVIDSTHVRLAFDDAFDPGAPLEEVRVGLWRMPDSVDVEVAGVMHGHAYEPEPVGRDTMAGGPAAGDSLPMAADSAAARELLMREDSLPVGAGDRTPAGGVSVPEDGMAMPGGPAAPDSAAGVPEEDGPPLPGRELVVVTADPLIVSAEYRVDISGVVNIHGITEGGGQAEFQVPMPPPPDSTAVPADSAAMPGDSAAVRPDSTGVPSDSTGVSPDSTATPANSTAVPAESAAMPAESAAVQGVSAVAVPGHT